MNNKDQPIVITVELTRSEAWMLAQLVKRITWSDCEGLSAPFESVQDMMDAVCRVQRALDEQGISPR